jgi:hypothetical protein
VLRFEGYKHIISNRAYIMGSTSSTQLHDAMGGSAISVLRNGCGVIQVGTLSRFVFSVWKL